MPYYLGFDSSTQSLTAMVIEAGDRNRRVVFERAFEFDRELPDYGTTNGVRRSASELEVTSTPLMWADALDRMMAHVARHGGFDVQQLAAIAGSGQQHGSVYLNASAAQTWDALDPRRALAEQVGGIFSRPESPVWMDESTRTECDAIEQAVGGAEALARLTGSRAYERFTGPQIRKFYLRQPDAWNVTDRIHLVSSFLASLLAGAHAPLEPGDGSGMNLMDIRSLSWAPAALGATAPELARRLPPIERSWTVAGPLASYWQLRYGFPAARVIAWSGDNPCALVGAGLAGPGRVGISLGTSDTIFGYTEEPRIDPHGAAHVFGSPTGGYMSLVCFRNGSLARERIRDDYGLAWEQFSSALRATTAGNHGGVLLPWFEPEITPPVRRTGARRLGVDPGDAAANVRAVIEAQMVSMRLHSPWRDDPPRRIHATGGASANREILQVMADVFEADVYQMAGGNSACLGAALRAFHADQLAAGRQVSWDDVVAGFTDPVPGSHVAPIEEHAAIYREMMERYAALEADALG
jgi:xylulokinase